MGGLNLGNDVYSLKTAGIINVLLGRRLVLVDKVLFRVTPQPNSKLANLLAQPRHRLLVHVCLGQQLRQRDNQPGKVFGSIHVADAIVLRLIVVVIPQFPNFNILMAFKTVLLATSIANSAEGCLPVQ